MVDTAKAPATGAESVVWDLSPLYTGVDDPKIDNDMQRLQEMADRFASTYRGRVADLNASELRAALESLEQIYDLNGKLVGYASLIYSTDAVNTQYGAFLQRMTEFDAGIKQRIVFFDLEWNQADETHAQAVLADPGLAPYRHYLEALRRYQPHQLEEGQEQVLLQKNVTGREAWTRFFSQLMSSARYTVDGEELTQTQVLSKLYDPDRDVRRKAAAAITEGLKKRSMELTYIFNVLAADKATDDRLRQYATWVSSRNLSNKAPDEVVEALVTAVTSNYEIVARHYNLKRKLLGLDELTDYDRYAPLALDGDGKRYTWDEARNIVLNAFDGFSTKMGDEARRFFDGEWIHAALLPNKQGGAYASPMVPSVHPYVFLNYTGQARDVATLAHELGHGIHMTLSSEAQGLFGLYTPLTTAEMASVFAEMLVFNDLMEK
jgi:oligoendopeptidase F